MAATNSLIADSNGSSGAIAVLIVIVIGVYLIPTLIATLRHVPNVGSVLVINIFLGWTFLGWIIALAMAMRSAAQATVVNVHQGPSYGSSAPAGWYPDPRGKASQRYYDGRSWTEHTA